MQEVKLRIPFDILNFKKVFKNISEGWRLCISRNNLEILKMHNLVDYQGNYGNLYVFYSPKMIVDTRAYFTNMGNFKI